MSEIIQSYTGTLDNLNMSGLVFSLNMSGAQSTLGDHKFALRSITFTKPSSSGYQDPVYLNLWEMKEGESTYTYITSSTNASNTTTSSDGVWNFTGVELDIDSKYYITVTASPSSVMSDLILLRSRVYSVPSGSGVGSHNYINNYNPPSLQFNWMPVMSLTLDETIEGSINISKGYYNNGTYKIISQGTTASLTDLKQNQTVGCKNNLFMTSSSGVAAPYLSSTEAPAGTFDVSVKLDTPVYLDWTKKYIAGGAEIAPEWSFINSDFVTNYTVVGSPTITDDYVVSGFSNSNYVKIPNSFPSSFTSADMIFKVNLTSTSSNSVILCRSSASEQYYGIKANNRKFSIYNSGWTDGTNALDLNTWYWCRVQYDGTTWKGYTLEDNNYTLATLPDISNWRQEWSTSIGWVSSNSCDIGNNFATTAEYFHGEIDLLNCSISLDGTNWWRAVEQTEAAISTTKALSYDSGSDKTYWYPQTTSVTLADVKDAQTVNMKNHLYCTNTTGFSTASHTFCVGTPAGVTEYYQQPEYVWLTSDWNTILGVQEEPDEIVLEGGPWTQPTLSSNGIWGGAEFAVSSSTVLSSNSEAWKAFDGIPDTSSNDRWHSSSGHPSWIGWYNPEPLIITNIQVQNRAVDGSFINSYDVSYSDDGSTWTVSTSGTSPDQTDGAYWNIPISETTGHKYWKLISNSSSGSNSDYTAVGLITLTAHTDSIKASDSHYWTYLQSDTYDVQGATLAISSMSPSALTGHLMMTTAGVLSYSEVNAQLSIGGLLPGAAYTGYDVTFTDNTYTAIDSVDKVGTRYRIYRSAGINPEVPIEFVAMSYEDYGSFAGGALPSASKSYGLTVDSPIEYTSTTTFTLSTDEIQGLDYYNPTEDKFYVYETGLWTGYQALSYIGDMYVIDSTGA